MRSAPGFTKSRRFLNRCALALPSAPLCFPATLYHAFPTSPMDSSMSIDDSNSHGSDDEAYHWLLQPSPARNTPLRFDFHPDKAGEPPSSANIAHDTQQESSLNIPSSAHSATAETLLHKDKQDLFTLHHRLGHMPFSAICNMHASNACSKRLMTCPLPIRSACLFAKATKRAWRSKADANTLQKAKAPGDIVSIDQLESSTPGLVAQAKGRSTKSRFTCAPVFVHHYSRLTYLHMQESNGALETLSAKHAFEQYARSFDVAIRHYHGDNGLLLKMPSKPIVRKRDNSYLFVAPTRIFRTALQNGKSETFKIVHVP